MEAKDTILRYERIAEIDFKNAEGNFTDALYDVAREQAKTTWAIAFKEGYKTGYECGLDEGKKAGMNECAQTHFKPDWKIKAQDIKDATEEGCKAGIRKVVESLDWENTVYQTIEGSPVIQLQISKAEWQDKLREWGIERR